MFFRGAVKICCRRKLSLGQTGILHIIGRNVAPPPDIVDKKPKGETRVQPLPPPNKLN